MPAKSDTLQQSLHDKLSEAEYKALDNLSRYKFMNFGYHAAMFVTLNKIVPNSRPNPFRELVHLALKLKSSLVYKKGIKPQ